MTHENRRARLPRPSFFAAFGLALALLPSAALASPSFTVNMFSTAAYATDVTVSSFPVFYFDSNLTSGPGTITTVTVSMFGDVPPNTVSAALWKDANANDVFEPGFDTMVGSAAFVGGNGSPASASIKSATSQSNGTTRYWVSVDFNDAPATRKVQFAVRQPTDMSFGGGFLTSSNLPVASTATVLRLTVWANPAAGVYASPVAGAGGQETGLFVHAGQRLHVETPTSDTWSVPAPTDANGSGAGGVLTGGLKGRLVGRIGSGAWFALGQTSTVTVASSGQLFLAPDDDGNWGDNTGSVRAQIEVLPSTSPRVWIGGQALGFETSADIDQNWQGGKPYPGEHVYFYASGYDCDWNIPNLSVADVFVSTAFTRQIRLSAPQFQSTNRLTTTGDFVVQGGSLVLAPIGAAHELSVGGRLLVSSSATLTLGGKLILANSAEVTGSAFLRSQGGANVYRNGPTPYFFRVVGATVSIATPVTFNDPGWLEISSASAVAWSDVSFQNVFPSTVALVILRSAANIDQTFVGWQANGTRSVGVDAFGTTPGSTITFVDSAYNTTIFGSPNTQAFPGVVRWTPDGGYPINGTIGGTVFAPLQSGPSYLVEASTSPTGGGTAGNSAPSGSVSAGLAGYTIGGLRTPSTYYLFATLNTPDERGGYNHPGYMRSDPIFLDNGATVGGKNITVVYWGAVQGSVSNLSNQLGAVRVETWDGSPNLPTSTRTAVGVNGPSGFLLPAPSSSPFTTTTRSSFTFAYVDLDANGQWDSFEASTTVSGYNFTGGQTFTLAPVTLLPTGTIPPGAAVTLSSAAAHFNGVGRAGPQPLIRFRMTAAGASTTFSAARLRYLGVPPANNVGLAVWKDDGDLSFDPRLDTPLGVGLVNTATPSTTTIVFQQPAFLPSASPRDFFVTLDLGGASVPSAGVMIDAATSFALTAGTFTATPGFPVSTGLLAVFDVVRASETATAGNSGGAPVGTFVYQGQTLSFSATGQWTTGGGDPITGPNGLASTTGLDTLLPSANRGELIARVQPPANASTAWFRVGASTTVPAPSNGTVYLAMNDYVNSYYDNAGSVLAGFTVTGSTLGAIAGQLDYAFRTPGSTVTITARLNGSTPAASTQVVTAGATYYPFVVPGLNPGQYDILATNSGPADVGLSGLRVDVVANATATLDARMYPSVTGSISGNVAYSGTLPYGAFNIAVATVTDFTQRVTFYGSVSTPTAGAWTIGGLPTPATYYVVAFRDGNGNNRPDGPEPFGYVGTAGGGIATLPSFLSPVFVSTGASSTGNNLTLGDLGTIEGNAGLTPGATGALVVEAGQGVPGLPGYVAENKTVVVLPPGGAAPGGQFYSLDLLRPTTGYSVFAFLDQNGDRLPGAGEPQTLVTASVNVPVGGRARADLNLTAVTAPPPPAVFTATPQAVSTVTFAWNLVPGATAYQLRRADASILSTLSGSTSIYYDVLADNTSSQIRSITASNVNGTSVLKSLPGPVFSRATAPTSPAVSGVTALSATVSWTSTNGPSTQYDLQRATATGGVMTRVYLGAAPTFVNALAPGATYQWRVSAIDGNGVASPFSAAISTVTPTAAGPAVGGFVTYLGSQTANLGVGFVVEASTNSTTFVPRASSAALAGASFQPYYLPVPPAANYYVRAYVDVAGNGTLQPGADRGLLTPPASVGASLVSGQNFAVVKDTVAPGAPAGVVAVPGFKKVTVSWAAPTRSADNSALSDLLGYDVERASSPSAGFVSVTPVRLSSSTQSYVDNSPFPGQNLYRVRALDFGGNASAPSGAVTASPSSGGSISGALRIFTVTANGQYRVRLTTSPAPGSASVAEANLSTYSFTGLADGVYYLRAFRDVDGDGLQDPLNEPAGTYGGLNAPFPIAVVNGNAVTAADGVICDRSGLQTGNNAVSILSGGCPALDKGPGWYTQLYAVRVGGGQSGSLPVGAQLNVAVSTGLAYDTEIIAVGPNGNVAGRDNRAGGANLTLTLSTAGVYLFEPTTFLQFGTGAFTMKARIDGGFAGVISGTVTYSGGRPGLLWTQLFPSGKPTNPILTSTAPSAPASYVFSGLPDGQYSLRSFKDANGNGVRDGGEPVGQFGPSASTPTFVSVVGGVVQGAPPFVIPVKDPAVGAIQGSALYEGSAASPIRVEVRRFTPTKTEVYFTTVAANTNYLIPFLSPATDYYVNGLVDINGNGREDPLEATISSGPIAVTANSTATVSLIIRDSGIGQSGTSVVGGTVTYSGPSTGPIFIGLSRDPNFRSVDYLTILPAAGYYQRGGLAGNATYYMAAFIDTNRNNNPDAGEVQGVGKTALDFSTPTFANPPAIFVAVDTFTGVKLDLYDPSNGSIRGVVSYPGSAGGQNIIVQAIQNAAPPGTVLPFTSVFRPTGVSTFSYSLDYLDAGQYDVSAWLDSNGNGQFDQGEPGGGRGGIQVSSGSGVVPRYGQDVTLYDPGYFGASQSAGSVHGELIYLGSQSGDLFVRFFTNDAYAGAPVLTVRVPAPTPGAGQYTFTKSGLPFGDYWLDAFRDPSNLGVYNPAIHAYGRLNLGEAVSLTQYNADRGVFGGSITDPGQGGSVNQHTGSFASAGGVRFDGGATDLAAFVFVDPYTTNNGGAPQPLVLGISNQNPGTAAMIERYGPTGTLLASRVLAYGDLEISNFALDEFSDVYIPGRKEVPNTNLSSATITVYDESLNPVDYSEWEGYQGFDGIAYSTVTGRLHAAGRYLVDGTIRAVSIDPATNLSVMLSTGVFTPPPGCNFCGGRVKSAALSPNGSIYVIYAVVNQQGDSDRGVHYLIKFNAATMSLLATKDVTSLGVPGDGGSGTSMAVTNDGQLYLTFATNNDTAQTYKFDVSASQIVQVGHVSYGPIKVHFGGGLQNMNLDPGGDLYEVWESTTNAGDYMLLRYDPNLVLRKQQFFDGADNAHEDTTFSVSVYDSSNVFVAGSVDNGTNLDWGIKRFNGNQNGTTSAAGSPVAITTTNAVSYIFGNVVYNGTLVTSGTIRASLTAIDEDVPIRFATAAFGASRPFLFNNVPDGVYDVRVFIDNNTPQQNLTPDEGEPTGASSLYGIEFAAGDSQTLADPVQLCDRRQIAIGATITHALTSADCTSPDRPGAARRLYTFRGTRGTPVTIAMKAIGFYDSYIDLYGPDGDWIQYDDDSGGNGDARISNFTLPEDGIYTIDASAYGSGSLGAFQLSVDGSAGAVGSIAGRVDYAGTQGGNVIVGLFDSTTFSTATTVGRQVLQSTRVFSFDGLAVGSTYYLGAFIDVNGSGAPDPGEDSGVFGSTAAPTPILLQGGQNVTGVEISVVPSTAGAAAAAYVTGQASYSGSVTGPLVLEFWANSQFAGRPSATRVVPTGVGAYDTAVAGGVPYYVRAFVDANGDFTLQPDEPRGVYQPHNQGAEQVYAPSGQTLVNVDMTLKDPGDVGTAIAGAGTAVLASTYVVTGATATITVTYTAAASGISAGGQVGFTAPPGFSFPQSAAVSSVTATSVAGLSAVTYSGPSAFVTLTGPLAGGQTIKFVWSTVTVPCGVSAATVTVSAVSNNTAAPAPLFVGSPVVGIEPGPATYAALDEPYFTVKVDELSDVRRVVTYNDCGAKRSVSAALTVDLRTRQFNGTNFVADPLVGVATNTVLSTTTALSLDFAVDQSSASFYVLAASTGFKYLEVHSPLGFGATYYFGVTAVPANALTAVSVSTAAGGVALSSATIGLAANGQPNGVFLNFTLGDPQQPWHVLVSSLPFKTGERPSAVWERWGYGQPNKGEIAWDGRYSPWINGGGRVPNGLYYGRVELGGGGVKDDTIRVTVALPQFSGKAYDSGTNPYTPLSAANLRVYGPAGYYTATTDASGDYVLPGLGAGNYRVNLARADYVDGAVDMTLNGSGLATSFIPRTTGVQVSSNATGGLDFYVARAPRLVVVPSLDPSVGAVAADQWGGLQVRTSTAAGVQQATFFGPMRLKGGTTTFDDGGQWDSSTQQFIARTRLGFNVPVGTYTVVGDLGGYSRSTAAVYVGPDGARVDLPPFVPKAVISGQVGLSAAAPAGGLNVGITATALSTATATSSLSAGTFVNGGSTWAAYSISGFDPGGYILRANTQGLSAATTGPITVVGTTTLTGVDFPNFGAGATISGSITAGSTVGRPIYVNAWSPGSLNFGSTVVYTNGGAVPYALPGLDSGATYQIYANIDDPNTDYDLTSPVGGFPIKVVAPATQNFTLSPASGVINGTILLRAGASDFLNVSLSGVTIASLKPDEVGHAFTQPTISLPNFSCGGALPSNPSSSTVGGYCPGSVSSATFKLTGVNTQTVDVRFLHSTTGQTSRIRVSAVNGSTFTLVADLSASTYSISGTVLNQIADTFFNTNAKVVARAPYIAPSGYPSGISSTTARVTATRQEIDSFGVAVSTVFDPVATRVGFMNASGDYTIPNVPNGVWLVRTENLRACATCAIIAPSVSRVVSVAGAAVSSVTLTVSNGYSVSGSITLADGLQDSRIFNISVYNKRQELVRSTVAYLGDVNLGQTAGSVDYSFANLPAGDFYTLTVNGTLFPIKYVGRPIKFPDPALSPSGLQSSLVRQDVTMQRAAYVIGRLKDALTGELVTKTNATILAPSFAITATANPWTEGGFVQAASSVSARPIEHDGYFRVGPLLPNVSYDLRFAQTSWDPNFLASGSQNYAPVTIGGVKPTAGEVRDLGIVGLGQGQSITGVVKSTATGAGLGNIKVVAKPSFNADGLVVQTFTNNQGLYALWVSSVVSNQYTVTAAPRDGAQASDGKYYGQFSISNVNLQTQTTANFFLSPLLVMVTGQVVVADAGSGGALSYPFGDKRGFPAAAVNLQPVGIVPVNPLGDIETTTDERGFFSVPALSTGLYSMHATSLGYAVFNATVQVAGSSFHIFTGSNTPTNDLPGGVATLTRGATATGRILKSDGSAPNTSEVVGVAAANFGSGEFVVGSVEADPVAKTVNAYTISGFKTGVSYNIVLLSGSRGKEVSFPPEGAGVVFSAAESTTTKSINLTYRPATLDCLGTAKALDAGRTKFGVVVECLKPLRQQTALDDDLDSILTLSTFTALGAAVTSPSNTGSFSQKAFSTDRRKITAVYTLGASETRFSIRLRASASEVDPRTGDSFAIDKVFDFYGGLDAHSDGRATNIDGGNVVMQPSATDELLGLDERSRIDIPPGAFGEGSDSLADSTVVAQPTTTVNVSMTKGRDQQLAKALNIAARGYAPAALEVPDTPSAFPNEMWAAMSSYRTLAGSTSTVGGANPLSAFYSIFLPAGIRHQLKQRADLTLSYSLATSTGTADDKIQVWFYNAVLGRFVPETTDRRLDTVNKTITVSVDHFSTFVVLDSTPVATSSVTFGGTDIAAANFPNPADCVVHSNIARNGVLFGGGVHAPFTGTMIRYSIPPGGAAPLKINIYNVAGEKVRSIDQGDLPAGQTYYTPWDCRNDGGQTVSSGVYIGEVIHGGRRKFFKIAIIKGSGL